MRTPDSTESVCDTDTSPISKKKDGTPAPSPASQTPPAFNPQDYMFQPRSPVQVTVVSTQVITYDGKKTDELNFDPSSMDWLDDGLDFLSSPIKIPSPLVVAIEPPAVEPRKNRLSLDTFAKLKQMWELVGNESALLANPSAIREIADSIKEILPEQVISAISKLLSLDDKKADFNAALDRLHPREALKYVEAELKGLIQDANSQNDKLLQLKQKAESAKLAASKAVSRVKSLKQELKKAKKAEASARSSFEESKSAAKEQYSIVKACGLAVLDAKKRIPIIPGSTEEDSETINQIRDTITSATAAIFEFCEWLACEPNF